MMEANRLVGERLRMALQMEANPLVWKVEEEEARVRMALPLQMEARLRMGLLLLMRKMTSSLLEAVGTEARKRETVTRKTMCKQHQNQRLDWCSHLPVPTTTTPKRVDLRLFFYITDSSSLYFFRSFLASYWEPTWFFFLFCFRIFFNRQLFYRFCFFFYSKFIFHPHIHSPYTSYI